MLKWMVFQFVLAAVCCCVCITICASEATGGLQEAFAAAKESQHQRHQVSSWSPFSHQWQWLNNVLSLRENQIDEASTNSQRETNHPPPSTTNADDDDSMLSLVLLLDQSDEEDMTKNKISKVSPTAPPPPPVAPFEKRSSRTCVNQGNGRCRRGQVSMIPADQVFQRFNDDYSSVPDVLIKFSQKQAEETVCNDLSVQLFRVDLKEHYLEPVWVREIVHLGMCPSELQTRHLGEHVWPTSIVETKCLCHHKTCSNLGGDFRCQAVRRPIRTWVRHMEKFIPDQEMVTVGCVCVQRNSPEGKYAKPAMES